MITVIRRFVGYDRYIGHIAGQTLAHLYGALRLFVNYFQPSFKLVEKTRDGTRVTKHYDKPATPCDRLLEHGSVGVEVKDRLRENRARLDPVVLLHTIRQAQSALVAVTSPEGQAAPNRESLEQFLSQLPDLWRLGEVRPTHAQRDARPWSWRTRKDPFEGVWSDILLWLQQEPDATAKALLERLRPFYPGRFTDGQLRTLQRGVRQWRGVMAKELIYASADQPMPWGAATREIASVGVDSRGSDFGNIPR